MLHNELCQSLNNGALAYTRFPDENRIVLFSAAQYLCDTQDFLFTSDHFVKLSFCCSLGQIGRKVIKNRRSFLLFAAGSLGESLFPVGSLLRHSLFFFLFFLGHTETIRGFGIAAHLGFQVSERIFIIHMVFFQNFLSSIVHLIMQDSQHKMLHVNHLCMLYTSLENCEFQDVVGLFIQHEFRGNHGRSDVILPYPVFQFSLYIAFIDIHALEKTMEQTVLSTQYT